MKEIEERKKEGGDLSKDVIGQTGASEEGNGFNTADTAVTIQIGTTEVSIVEIHIRHVIQAKCNLL